MSATEKCEYPMLIFECVDVKTVPFESVATKSAIQTPPIWKILMAGFFGIMDYIPIVAALSIKIYLLLRIAF